MKAGRAARVAIFGLILLIAFCFVQSPFSARANSAPVYYDSFNRGELTVGDPSGVGVDSEVLTFDFTNDPTANNCLITAEYAMTAQDDANLTLMFPYENSYYYDLQGTSPHAKITLDGSAIKPKIYYTNLYSLSDNVYQMSAQDILDKMITVPYDFGVNYTGTLYRVQSPVPVTFETRGEESYAVVGARQTNNITDGDKHTAVIMPDFGASPMWVLTFGYESQFAPQSDAEITAEAVETDYSLNDMISTYLTRIGRPDLIVPVTHYRKDNYWEPMIETVCDMFASDYSVAVMLFDVPFTRGSHKLTVSYKGVGNRKPYYSPSVYLYRYFTSPAKEWEYFENLEIRVRTNELSAFVVSSTVELTKTDYGYTYSGGLPENNLFFEVCSSSNPKKAIASNVGEILVIGLTVVVTLILIAVPVALIVTLTLLLVSRRAKKNDKAFEAEVERVRTERERKEAAERAASAGGDADNKDGGNNNESADTDNKDGADKKNGTDKEDDGNK